MSDILDRIKGFVVKRSEVNPFSHVVEIEADEFNELIHALGAARDEIEQLQNKERHMMDLYDSLGIKWGDDPFPTIAEISELREWIVELNGFRSCAASCIKSGESWTPAMQAAFERSERPETTKDCGCYECSNDERRMTTMITCIYCGNKRCPKASNHIYDCTDSNEPGQPGSRYVSDKNHD